MKCYLVKITICRLYQLFLDFYPKERSRKPVSGSRHIQPLRSMETVESAYWPDDRAPFFWTCELFDAQITGNGIRSRSSRNVFVMPIDAYLYRIYGFIATERDFEIKLPPRTDQYQARKKARKRGWKGGRHNEDEQNGDVQEGEVRREEENEADTLNLEGLSRPT